MEIIHRYLTPETIDSRIFARLLRNNLFSKGGILRKVYLHPLRYIKEEAYLSVMTDNEKIISLMFVSRGQYYGWQYAIEEVGLTYGSISFYTKNSHRRKGYATQLYQDFNKTVKLPRLSASYRNKQILESVPGNENTVYFGTGFDNDQFRDV